MTKRRTFQMQISTERQKWFAIALIGLIKQILIKAIKLQFQI